jgi:hypothetical protein
VAVGAYTRAATMTEKDEVSLAEWYARFLCKLIAFGSAILGAGGLVIIGMKTILPLLDRGVYDGAACAGIACVAVMYGLAPLAVDVENALLRLCGGMKALPRHEDE